MIVDLNSGCTDSACHEGAMNTKNVTPFGPRLKTAIMAIAITVLSCFGWVGGSTAQERRPFEINETPELDRLLSDSYGPINQQ